MAELPRGTVSFLLTDVESSTELWELAPAEMIVASRRHDELVAAAVAEYGGARPEEQGEGDSLVAAFPRASDALMAARRAQEALATESWPTPRPLRVRMAVHAGEALLVDESKYAGSTLNRAARLRSLACGGQVLVSASAAALARDSLDPGMSLVDLGHYRLRGLERSEQIFELRYEGWGGPYPSPRAPAGSAPHLPLPPTPFIGRASEVAAGREALAHHRLVTPVGAGGSGKTRLALELAARAVEDHPGGVWWVDLSGERDADGVPDAVLRAMRERSDVTGSPTELLLDLIGSDRLLLVLDNCEHLLPPVVELVTAVLGRCPGVTILATSRAMLDAPGEHTVRVPSMNDLDASTLFGERAKHVRASFDPADHHDTIAAICRRLDGMPLAIELAAARALVLAPHQILQGLDDALTLLTNGRHNPPRQRTMEASIAWSNSLLAPRTQHLLRQLSMFLEGWDVEAAQAVAAPELGQLCVLDELERLIETSLVATTDSGERPRFFLHETVRQFAARLLAEHGEEEATADRHARHYAELLMEWSLRAEEPNAGPMVARARLERANLRKAVQHFLDRGRADEIGPALIREHVFSLLELQTDADDWMMRAREQLGDRDPVLTLRLSFSRASQMFFDDRFLEALAELERIREQAVGLDDWSLGRATMRAGQVLAAERGIEPADPVLQAARAAAERAGDRFTQGHVDELRGTGFFVVRRFAEACESFDRVAASALNDSWQGLAQVMDQYCKVCCGSYGEVDAVYERNTRLADDTGDALLYGFNVLVATLAAVDRCRDRPNLFELDDLSRAARRRWAGLARALLETGVATRAWADGAFERALEATQVSLAPGSPSLSYVKALSALVAAGVWHAQGDAARARGWLEVVDGVVATYGTSKYLEARGLIRRGWLALDERDGEEAAELGQRALDAAVSCGARPTAIDALELLAAAADERDDVMTTGRLLAAAQTWRDALGYGRRFVPEADRIVELLDRRSTQAAFIEALGAGSILTPEEAVAFATCELSDPGRLQRA